MTFGLGGGGSNQISQPTAEIEDVAQRVLLQRNSISIYAVLINYIRRNIILTLEGKPK